MVGSEQLPCRGGALGVVGVAETCGSDRLSDGRGWRGLASHRLHRESESSFFVLGSILSGPDRRFAVTRRRSGVPASRFCRGLGLFPEEGGRVSGGEAFERADSALDRRVSKVDRNC